MCPTRDPRLWLADFGKNCGGFEGQANLGGRMRLGGALLPGVRVAPPGDVRHPPPLPGFRVQGSGFRVQGSGFRVQGSGFKV